MRKFLIALIAVAFGVVMAIPSFAAGTDRVNYHQVLKPLRFRRHTTVAPFKLDEAGVGCVDSSFATSAGNGKSAGGADTTVAVNLLGLPPPAEMTGAYPATTALDTTATIGRFIIEDQGPATNDSIYVHIQASVDGVNWAPLMNGATFMGNILLDLVNGSSTRMWSMVVHSGVANANGFQAVGGLQDLRYWPLIRLIIQNDVAGGVQHKFYAWWASYSSSAELDGNP